MLKKMKHIVAMFLGTSVFFIFILQASAVWSAPLTGTEWSPLSRAGIKARFVVSSDIHTGSGYNSDKKLENALNAFRIIDPDMDAVIFAGDITNSGSPQQYDTLMDIVNKSSLGRKIIWSMGNHESYGWSNIQSAIDMFVRRTGQEPDKVCTPGAITVITLGSRSYDGGAYSEQYDFLEKALSDAAAKDSNSPVFVIAHHGIEDSVYATKEWYGNYGEGTDKDMVALMAKYPQVIHISGHSHATVDVPESIDQSKGFTCIQDATLGAFFENEGGSIASDGKYSNYPEYSGEASQALLVDVKNDNSVVIRRMDLTKGKYIYKNEPWVINIPDLVKNRMFTYTGDRAVSSKPAAFPDDARVTVTNAEAGTVTFSFSRATEADDLNDNMIYSYKLKITDTNTGKAIMDTKSGRDYYLRFSDYYRPTTSATLSAKISGLSPGTQYKIEVWALNPYNQESRNSINTVFSTTEDNKAAFAGYNKDNQAQRIFKDMEKFGWADEAVGALTAKGIVSGTSKSTFSPEENITRADFIVMLVKALGLSTDIENNFDDVGSDSYYYDYVGIARVLDIASGTDENLFSPQDKLFRQDMAVMAMKALKAAGIDMQDGEEADINGFKDASDISGYAVKAIGALAREGILKGDGSAVNPMVPLTRAEAAVVIYKMCN
jgi:predicted MPP superfamily phosphohydrolase